MPSNSTLCHLFCLYEEQTRDDLLSGSQKKKKITANYRLGFVVTKFSRSSDTMYRSANEKKVSQTL